MKTSRAWILLSSVVVVGLIVAACGGGAADPTATALPAATPTPVVVEREVVKQVPVEVEVIREVEKEVIREVEKEVIREVEKEVIREVEVIKEVEVEILRPPKFNQPVQWLTKYPPAPHEDWTVNDIKRGGTFRLGYSDETPHLDISQNKGTAVQQFLWQIYDPLVRIHSTFDADPYKIELRPALAESWEFTSDGKGLTFKLRPNVTWQNVAPVNGRAFTSADVKFSFEHYQADGTLKSVFAAVTSVETPDDLTAVVRFGKPLSGFIDLISREPVFVLPREILEMDGDFKQQAVGTGPFILTEWKRAELATFERNPSHWDIGLDGQALPYLDKIEILVIPDLGTRKAAFRAGQIDSPRPLAGKETEADEIAKSVGDAKITVLMRDRPPYSVGFDASAAPFNDVNVRRAFSMSFDRDIIGDVAHEGNYFLGPAVPWNLFHDRPPTVDDIPWTRYDPEAAKQLLADAGYADGIEKTLAWPGFPGVQQYAELIKSQAADAGFELALQVVDYATWSAEWYGSNAGFGDKLMIGFIVPGGYDYFTHFSSYLDSEGGKNYANIKDPEIDALLDRLEASLDPAEQQAIAQEIYDRELDQAYRPMLPGSVRYAIHSAETQNYRQVPLNIFPEAHNIRFAWKSDA